MLVDRLTGKCYQMLVFYYYERVSEKVMLFIMGIRTYVNVIQWGEFCTTIKKAFPRTVQNL